MKKLCELNITAANIYFSAVCNLRCRYCFQPKVSELNNKTNKLIRNWISSGKMEDDILEVFGEDTTDLALWGGEPSINFPQLIDRIPFIYKKFKNLNNISFSTNISTKKLAENIINLVKSINLENIKTSRNIKIQIQFSIDGPPELNDFNRLGSNAIEIMDNITYVLQNLKDIDSNCFSLSIKGTQSSDSLKWLMTGENLEYFYKFFDGYQIEWRKILGDVALLDGTFITFVYPGNFTQEDGLLFTELIKKQNSKEFKNKFKGHYVSFDNQMTFRIKQALSNLRSGYYREYKGELLSCSNCSAGRSSLGITYNGKIHLCQSTYMFDDDVLNYIEDNNIISEFEEIQGFSFRNYKNNVKNNIIVDKKDELRFSRLINNMNVFTQNVSTKVQFLDIIISHLAASGEISKIYLNNHYRDIAIALIIFGGSECPVDNIWEFSSPYVKSTSQIKLLLNGALEYYLDNEYKDILNINLNEVKVNES